MNTVCHIACATAFVVAAFNHYEMTCARKAYYTAKTEALHYNTDFIGGHKRDMLIAKAALYRQELDKK